MTLVANTPEELRAQLASNRVLTADGMPVRGKIRLVPGLGDAGAVHVMWQGHIKALTVGGVAVAAPARLR